MKGALNRDLETCQSCLGELLDFFTRPFSVTALLLTGANLATALETKSQHQSDLGSMYFVAIPIFLVVAKNFICPYVSLAAAELLLPGSENSKWHSFAFLYGLIPTSSAPMLVAMRVGKHIEVVAAAVSVGILVAFPMLIASAVLLGSTRIDEVRGFGLQVIPTHILARLSSNRMYCNRYEAWNVCFQECLLHWFAQ